VIRFERVLDAVQIEQLPGGIIARSAAGSAELKSAQQRPAAAAASENMRLDQILPVGEGELETAAAANCFLDRVKRHGSTRLIDGCPFEARRARAGKSKLLQRNGNDHPRAQPGNRI